jgi:hypothetical protein
MRLDAIVSALDLLEIHDSEKRLDIANKIISGVEALYQNQKQDKEEVPETFGDIKEDV